MRVKCLVSYYHAHPLWCFKAGEYYDCSFEFCKTYHRWFYKITDSNGSHLELFKKQFDIFFINIEANRDKKLKKLGI